MLQALIWIEIIVSVLLILVIILQQRGADVGGALGGGGGESSVFYSRRGAEKYLFVATIVLTVIFVATAVGIVLLQ
jgi:protein translocase SecG subunit